MESPGPNNNADKGVLINAICWAGACFATLFVAARFFTRVKIIQNLGLDDWLMLSAIILDFVGVAVVSEAVRWGYGRHQASLPLENVVQAVKYAWIAQMPIVLALTIARVSIAAFLLRLFAANKWLKWFLLVMTLVNTIFAILPLIMIFAQCTPVTALWDPPTGHCWNPKIQRDFAVVSSAITAFTDLTFALFPIALVFRLQMKLRHKLGLASLLGLGIVAMAATIVSTVVLWGLSARSDFTYESPRLYLWVVSENHVVFIAGCTPTLRPLWGQYFSRKSSPSGPEHTWSVPRRHKYYKTHFNQVPTLGGSGDDFKMQTYAWREAPTLSEGTRKDSKEDPSVINKTTDVDVDVENHAGRARPLRVAPWERQVATSPVEQV
ncbi:MAG: hypothetical protein ASARMPREDX12_006066 [Alectoria sarmentosa]|nr:MAG: hypothetical protein ASARMPREDX12_006066 [Alectoria sarmentosa]